MRRGSAAVHVIRSIRPTDLVALVTFETRAFPNEARTRDRLDREPTRPLPVGAILEHWISLDNRHTLVAAEGLAIHGLVSARHRAGRSMIEVDWLVLPSDVGSEDLSSDILHKLCESGISSSVRRIFLRLPKDSPLAGAVVRAGFVKYGSETLFRGVPQSSLTAASPEDEFRALENEDKHGLFRLYHAAVPQQVRAAEGMTFEEWDEVRDSVSGHIKEYVGCQDDRVWSWVRIIRRNGFGQFQFLLHPERPDMLQDVLSCALSKFEDQEVVWALIPEYQYGMGNVLREDWGFEEVAEYNTFVRHLTVRVPQVQLVPARG